MVALPRPSLPLWKPAPWGKKEIMKSKQVSARTHLNVRLGVIAKPQTFWASLTTPKKHGFEGPLELQTDRNPGAKCAAVGPWWRSCWLICIQSLEVKSQQEQCGSTLPLDRSISRLLRLHPKTGSMQFGTPVDVLPRKVRPSTMGTPAPSSP